MPVQEESPRVRRSFTVEFKTSAARLVREQRYTVTRAANSLGVDTRSIRDWMAEFAPRPQAAPALAPATPTSEGWVYLAAVIDLCTRKVVGRATADHLGAELPLEALRMALAHRKPAGELLHHSDRGA